MTTFNLDDKMTPLQAALWEFLRNNFPGVGSATPRAAILARFNLLRNSELDDRTFREIVSDLVVNFKKPICTTSAGGYYVARTMRDLDIAVRDLESRGAACLDRARVLKQTLPLERQEDLF